MKGKKKCIVFLTLFVLFAPLFLTSSDVNAKQYQIQKIPLNFNRHYYNNSVTDGVQSFEIETSSDIDPSSVFYQYVLKMEDQNGVCNGTGYQRLPTYTDNGGSYYFYYGFNAINRPNAPSNWGAISDCYGNGSMSNYNANSVSSLGSLFGEPSSSQLTNLLPYRFSYNGFYRTDTRDADGLYYTNNFDFQFLFGPQGYPNKISKIRIPLGTAKKSVADTLQNNTPITFNGEFVLDPDDQSTSFGLSNSTTFKLETYYLDQSGYSKDTVDCTYRFYHKDTDEEGIYTLSYKCPTTLRPAYNSNDPSIPSWNPSNQIVYFRLLVDLDYTNPNNTKLFQFIYDSSVSVTNNDPTPGGSWDDPVQGANTHVAPGSSYQSSYSETGTTEPAPNYTLSLQNLFGFNFINPFAPLFNLFTDQGSCAQIPTIASMIHSEETQVCPWFSSSTRNIVTPVLGLSSVMLIFGFTVRWLGARSGNLFEDSMETENFSFSNKFRRKK